MPANPIAHLAQLFAGAEHRNSRAGINLGADLTHACTKADLDGSQKRAPFQQYATLLGLAIAPVPPALTLPRPEDNGV